MVSLAVYWGVHSSRERSLTALHLEPLTGDAPLVQLADLPGEVTVINFWGTWCPPCREEFPHIVELYKKYQGRSDFRLLSVSCRGDAEEDSNLAELRESTEAFLKQRDAEMPTYVDLRGVTRHALNEAIGFQGYPTTLILDRRGVIRGHWVGYQPGMEISIAGAINRLLENK